MTKWLITFRGGANTTRRLVEFGGPTGSESTGIVDVLAIRKDHKRTSLSLERGDYFEMILIQTKGGSATRPPTDDIRRHLRVAVKYDAKAVGLAEWKKGTKLQLYRLVGADWEASTAKDIFG